MAGIKQLFLVKEQQSNILEQQAEKAKRELTDDQLRKLLRNELIHSGRNNRSTLRQGDLSRFFH
jgi:MerR family glutamine synthetase transcriptional repressor